MYSVRSACSWLALPGSASPRLSVRSRRRSPSCACFVRMQGVCAALVTPTALAVIIHVFPEDERARAIGTWTALSSIVGVIGPFIGGVLIAAGSWRLIFVLNAPLVLVTVTLIARGVPGGASAGTAERLDFPGALLAAVALSGSVFAVTEQPARGWSTLVVGSLAVGILGAIAFIAHEARARAPMLPLSLFRERNFTIGNLATLTSYLGLGGVIFLLPVFLQEVSGYSPVQAGLALLPVTLLMIVLSRRFGALADRIGSRVLDKPRGAGCCLWPFAFGACRSARRLRQRGPAGAARVRVGTRDAGRAADRHGPWGSGGGSRRRRRRGEYDALTRRAAFRGRRAGSRRLARVCQSRRRDATTIRDRSRWPRGDQPRQATASRRGEPGGSTRWRAGRPQERPSTTRRCMRSAWRTQSPPSSSRAEVSSRSPGSVIPAARWPPNCVQLGRSAEPAKNSSTLASFDLRAGVWPTTPSKRHHGGWAGEPYADRYQLSERRPKPL